jgi:hypothetical protein
VAHPLESAKLKVERAHDHVRVFNQHVKRFLESDPYLIVRELENDGAQHVYSVRVCGKPPPYLGTIVGDVFHNLRSALDSVVYDLSAPSIPTLTKRERRSIGFPIALDKGKYDPSPARFASEAAQTQIERAQPYHGEIPADEPLGIIHELNRVDKHRHVLVVPAIAMGAQWKRPGTVVSESFHPLGPFEDGAELARFRLTARQPEVDMEFRPMFHVSLGDRAYPASTDLERCLDEFRMRVFPLFEPYVP